MENNVLQDLLDRVIGDSFGCVFSKDEYVKMDTGKFYVYNNAKKPFPGHFISLYINKYNCLEVFDTSGRNILPSYITSQVKSIYTVLKIQIQSSLTQVCSIYCIFWILKRFRGCSNKNIISNFTSNFDKNDSLIYTWYNSSKLFKQSENITLLDTPFITNKLSRVYMYDMQGN